MFKNALEKLGFSRYCVTFTMFDTYEHYAGMLTVNCYAKNKLEAKIIAENRLHSLEILYVGNWDIRVEEI